MLASLGHVQFSAAIADWVSGALSDSRVELVPLRPEIAVEACNLPGRFHKDPADRMIVATARIAGATLITRDDRILDYARQGFVGAIKA